MARAPRPDRWNWHGVAALIIALCVGGAWGATFIVAVAFHQPLQDATSDLLGTIGGGLLTALGTFMGAAVVATQQRRDPPKPPDDPPSPGGT